MDNFKKRFYKSQKRFTTIDGNMFEGCLNQVYSKENECLIEWRIRKSNNKLCIIHYYPDNKGYNIFEYVD